MQGKKAKRHVRGERRDTCEERERRYMQREREGIHVKNKSRDI